ncbi:Haloacid dehalogenase domain protein hydrolase [Kribbella flavida DSM 17836]|uniref:Haloacid dehalogenase domain protein hydrolase n=1 Tax=Kribbella flavida (strain DSM 17836 / JCM 10339 / NBRC 14399) TaxID=479435 RepID=D2PWK0_KRIFD|nr:HAD family hydrolase [Kribbella flavida]ADB33469.1 Haloacid dehalogenase domain protein hydrolase [Kribbella flavida DSM 17836]
MRLKVSHIVWDWNGTLLDDNAAVLAAVNEVCAGFGRPPLSWDEWREVYARPMRLSYERILDRELSEDDWAKVDKLYHERYDLLLHTCGLAPGVPDGLHAWSASGRTQSLLSMWFHAQLVPTIDGFGLTELFSRVDGLTTAVGGDSKAEHLARHLTAQDLDPTDVVLIGDVVDDATAAASVGAQCVLVTTGAMSRTALQATGFPVTDSVPDALTLLATD